MAALSLVALFIIAGTEWSRDTGRIDEMLHGERYAPSSFDFDAITFRVTTIDPPAEAAGLRKGDVVLAVNGRSIGGVADYIGAVRRARAGDRLRVRIRRSTSEVQRHDADRDASRLSHNVSELCLIWHYAESLRRLA